MGLWLPATPVHLAGEIDYPSERAGPLAPVAAQGGDPQRSGGGPDPDRPAAAVQSGPAEDQRGWPDPDSPVRLGVPARPHPLGAGHAAGRPHPAATAAAGGQTQTRPLRPGGSHQRRRHPEQIHLCGVPAWHAPGWDQPARLPAPAAAPQDPGGLGRLRGAVGAPPALGAGPPRAGPQRIRQTAILRSVSPRPAAGPGQRRPQCPGLPHPAVDRGPGADRQPAKARGEPPSTVALQAAPGHGGGAQPGDPAQRRHPHQGTLVSESGLLCPGGAGSDGRRWR